MHAATSSDEELNTILFESTIFLKCAYKLNVYSPLMSATITTIFGNVCSLHA